MTDRIEVDTDEIDRLVTDLDGLPLRFMPAVSRALIKSIHDVVADAQVFVPVDTGATRNSIHAAATGTNRPPQIGDLDVEAGPTTEYAPELEYGTSKMAPHAFMGPAHDRRAPDLVDALANITRQAEL